MKNMNSVVFLSVRRPRTLHPTFCPTFQTTQTKKTTFMLEFFLWNLSLNCAVSQLQNCISRAAPWR